MKITLAKMPKGWFVPADALSYDIMRQNGINQLLVSSWFLPTLRLALSRKKVQVEEVSFADTYLIPKLDRLGASWMKRNGCRVTTTLQPSAQSSMVLSAPKTEQNLKLIAGIEANLASFFLRWGVKFYSDFNDKGAKYRLNITFQFKGDVSPIIPTLQHEDKKVYDLVLGFTKIRISFYEKASAEARAKNLIAPAILTEVFTQIGTEWAVVHTGTCKPSQVGDLAPLVGVIGELSAKCKQHAN